MNKIVLPKEIKDKFVSYLVNDGVARIDGVGEFTIKVTKNKRFYNPVSRDFIQVDAVKLNFRPFVKIKRVLRSLLSTG